jgi:hypothetical protein
MRLFSPVLFTSFLDWIFGHFFDRVLWKGHFGCCFLRVCFISVMLLEYFGLSCLGEVFVRCFLDGVFRIVFFF